MCPHPVTFALKLNIYAHPPGTPFRTFVELARTAEACGFTGAYTIDHLFLPRDIIAAFTERHDPERPYFLEAWTALAALAASTERLRLGPQVSPVALRHPVFLAKMGATLDLISGGRLVLQLGAGWHEEEFRAFGFPWDGDFKVRFGKLVEGVEVIKALWESEGPVHYAGRHYRLEGAPFWPKPLQRPRPPFWFGGTGKGIRRVVAEHGDAWTPAAPHHVGLDAGFYARALAEIREMAASFGRDPESILPGALFCTCIAPTREEAYRMASGLFRRADWSGLDIPQLMARGCVIAGTPEDCIQGLERYVAAGVRHFSLSFIPISETDLTRRGLELYAERVLPHFRDR
ncbi:MAG: LLM class flavin-dependent oxidoreductase [Nitrospinota bacterium]